MWESPVWRHTGSAKLSAVLLRAAKLSAVLNARMNFGISVARNGTARNEMTNVTRCGLLEG
jgi:hypothetical protein